MFWTCFGVLFSEISFLQCVPWRVESSKCFQKIKKIPKFQKCPKSFPKRSKHAFNMFNEIFSKTFLPSLPWRVESSKCFLKKFQKYKNAQNRSQKCPNVFWTCFGVLSSEISFCPVYHGGWSLRNAFKNQKNFKIPKTPKNVPKVSKSVLNMFWGTFLGNLFCPVFHGGWSLRNAFKKSKKFQNSKNARKRSQKCPNVFWTIFEVIFSRNFLCPVLHGGSSLRNVFKKSRNFQNSKNAQNRSQKCPNVFWTIFEVIFPKIFFCPVFHGRSSLRKVFKKI